MEFHILVRKYISTFVSIQLLFRWNIQSAIPLILVLCFNTTVVSVELHLEHSWTIIFVLFQYNCCFGGIVQVERNGRRFDFYVSIQLLFRWNDKITQTINKLNYFGFNTTVVSVEWNSRKSKGILYCVSIQLLFRWNNGNDICKEICEARFNTTVVSVE